MIYNEIRKKTNKIKIGNISIGGDSKIAVQSMTNTDTHDKDATLMQIKSLEEAGVDIVRITVPDADAVDTIPYLKKNGVLVPIVADIHFDYRLAIKCAEVGVDKVRINPGNIGSIENTKKVVEVLKERDIPVRIGINGGSLEKELLEKYGSPTPEALAESAMRNVKILEDLDFDKIVISVKSSNVYNMIQTNRILSSKCNYPLHLGVTEAGSKEIGTLKNAGGISALLCEGIGDTIRVSLTANPIEEVVAAKNILKALEIEGQSGLKIVSCPTCGRTKIDLIGLSKRFEEAVNKEKLYDVPLKVALMGCVVNGPGEARESDFGIAGGNGEAVLFSHGEIIKKIKEDEIIPTLIGIIKENKK